MLKLLMYVLRNILRNVSRSILTAVGVAVSIFMFCAILFMNAGVQDMVNKSSSEQVLVVFQKNRY